MKKAQQVEKLRAWAYRARSRPVVTARSLFPARAAGYVAETRRLAGMAENRAAELWCRDRGDDLGAEIYRLCVEQTLHELRPHTAGVWAHLERTLC